MNRSQFGAEGMRGYTGSRMINGVPLNLPANDMGESRHVQKGDIRQLNEEQLRSLYRT